jgi:RNA polymerase sigma factor (sigma-70 family)
MDHAIDRELACLVVSMEMTDEFTDAELFTRWRAGDDVAGNALVRRHFDTIHRFFAARFDHGVTDLVQRCFLGAVQAKDRLPEGLSFRAYLLGIAHRQMLMAWRTQRRHDAVFAAGSVSAAARRTSPSAVAAAREEQRVLIRALRSLAIEQQSLLELFYWEELGIDEIAAILGIPAGTVKSRLHRARGLLREAIDRIELAPDVLQSTAQNLEAWARSLRAKV